MTPPKTAATTTRANGDATREKILDAAEKLFGEKGFDAVSLREITETAGVTLALAHYHFQTKDNIFAQAVARRAGILADLRRDSLAALHATGQVDVEGVLNAFMGPIFHLLMQGDTGWASYVRLLPRLEEEDRWLPLLSGHFDPIARDYLQALAPLVPTATPDRLSRSFTFVILLMLKAVSTGRRLDLLTDGASKSSDLPATYAALLPFCSAGFLAAATQ